MATVCKTLLKFAVPFLFFAAALLVFLNVFTDGQMQQGDKSTFMGGSVPVEIVSKDNESRNVPVDAGIGGFIDSIFLLSENQVEIIGWFQQQSSSILVVSTDTTLTDSRAIWYERSDLQGDRARKGFSLLLTMSAHDPDAVYCLSTKSDTSAESVIVTADGLSCFESPDSK